MTFWNVVKPKIWAIFRTTSRSYLSLSGRSYRYVFILGHMRSGSTLLAHILASHRDFAGAGESHISYQSAADLPRLVLQTCEFLHRPILRQTYIVDQINHQYISDEALLSDQVYRCIILIREPESALKSLMKLLKCPEKEALKVYIDRLASLTQYGVLLRKRAMLVEYDDLVDQTHDTLAALTRFLGLNSPLTPDYGTHRMTARIEGFGDPSNNIKSGRVMRTPSHDSVAVSNAALVAGTTAFDKCRERLRSVVCCAAEHAAPAATESKSRSLMNDAQ